MRNRLKAAAVFTLTYLLIVAGWPQPANAQQGAAASYVAGERVVTWYNFGKGKVRGASIVSGNSGTGSQTITVCPAQMVMPDGRQVNMLGGSGLAAVPITVDPQSSTQGETVTPTAVSLVAPPSSWIGPPATLCANVTASFNQTHSPSQSTNQVISGDGGLQEALNDAFSSGGGSVTVPVDAGASVTDTILTAAVPYPGVSIADKRGGLQYWNITPTAAAFLAAPTTLTAVTALPSATPVGAYGTGTYHLCIAYVDIAGNEGPCSADFSEAGLATGSFIFSAPAASTGAVGYTVYISLTSGTYALAYQVPLTSTICRLTQVETITPACAVTNANYNQTGATATVTAITVNTSPLALQLSGASTTADYVGASNSHTTYGYVSGSRVGSQGVVSQIYTPLTAVTTAATTVPADIGVVAIPANFMNKLGKTVRLCGKAYVTGNATSDTIINIKFLWDGAGSNTTGAPVIIGNLQAAAAADTAAVYTINFCETFTATVVGSTVTSGSLIGGESFVNMYLASAPTILYLGGDTFTATTGSLNLAGGAGFTSRIHVIYNHTGGTDTTIQLASLAVEAL